MPPPLTVTGPDLARISGSSLYVFPPSPSPPCNGSQSPLSPSSELSFFDDSPASPVTPDDGTPFYALSRHRSAQPLGHRYTSSDSIAPMELHPPVSNHHHSNSMSSLPRTRVATQAMLEANARRRVHPPQFVCSECGQQFIAQFSLKRKFSNEVLLLSPIQRHFPQVTSSRIPENAYMFAVSLDAARGSSTAATANVMRRARNVIRISSVDFIYLACRLSVARHPAFTKKCPARNAMQPYFDMICFLEPFLQTVSHLSQERAWSLPFCNIPHLPHAYTLISSVLYNNCLFVS